MGANQSPYTKDSSMFVFMRDYPWGRPLPKEAEELDIPLEVSLWGCLGGFLALFDKIGILALYADPDFGGIEN
mgnify:CR=1 FL=1